MTQPADIYEDGAADRRLMALGLAAEDLRSALRIGQGEARTWSEAAPPAMGGMARWGRINEHLRILKAKDGWTYENVDGLPVTVSPAKDFMIVATTGDGQTGRADGTAPTTKYAKGVGYQKAVESNPNQESLFDVTEVRRHAAKRRRALWVLLYRVVVTAEQTVIFAELSLPSSMIEQGYIDSWAERILLASFVIEHTPIEDDQNGEDTGSVDVPVERR